jgi:hypothetical protein
MGQPLNDAQCYDLLNETKDIAFNFISLTKGEAVPKNAADEPGPLFKKAYERYLVPLMLKYPDYNRWIMQAVAEAREGRPILFPTHNVHNQPHQGTRDQILKVMLLTGTGPQVFSAAKEIKLIPRDYPETEENLGKLRLTIKIMNDVLGQ